MAVSPADHGQGMGDIFDFEVRGIRMKGIHVEARIGGYNAFFSHSSVAPEIHGL